MLIDFGAEEESSTIKAALGADYQAYADWLIDFSSTALESKACQQPVNPAALATELLTEDYSSWNSIYDFAWFLRRPKIEPIVLGKIGDTCIKFSALPEILEPHEQEMVEPHDQGDVDVGTQDPRPHVDGSVLGLWSDHKSLPAGRHSDEGYGSSGSIHRVPTQEAPLEAFQQIGLLYSCKISSAGADPMTYEGWTESNYVLVINIQDDSIWVIWRKFVLDPNTGTYGLAKEIWRGPYAIFPDMEEEGETIIYAKVADNWYVDRIPLQE